MRGKIYPVSGLRTQRECITKESLPGFLKQEPEPESQALSVLLSLFRSLPMLWFLVNWLHPSLYMMCEQVHRVLRILSRVGEIMCCVSEGCSYL
jgi:hypothetical protein